MNRRNKSNRDHSSVFDNTTAKKIHDELIPEEFPEGPLGSPLGKDDLVQSKSTEWEKGQKRTSAYTYPDKARHDDLPRQTPGAHPLHDE